MAQITNKRLGELIQALFRILEKYPDGMKAGDALAALAATVTLTEYEAGSYESGRRFEKIVRFATVDTVRAGWLIKNDGIWTLIGEGAKALKLYKDPSEFHKKAAQIYQCWLKDHKKSKTGLDSPIAEESDREDESDKSVSVSYEEAKEQAQEKSTPSCTLWTPMTSRGLSLNCLKPLATTFSALADSPRMPRRMPQSGKQTYHACG